MNKIISQQKYKRYLSLSESLQNALFSNRSSDAVRKAAIFADKETGVSDLATLVGYVLLGYLNPTDFPKELQEELDVSEDVAKQILSQLDAEIFSLVEADLRKLYPPTIKTPTASAKGFTQEERDETAKEKKEVEKIYVGAFEKRFLKKTPPSSEVNPPVGKQAPKEEKVTPKTEIIPEKKPNEEKKLEIPKKEIAEENLPVGGEENISTADEKKEIPKIKPVIPLSTFIQSQFQPRQKEQNNNTLYKEQLPENTEKQEGKRKPPAPKLKGNVIDLRDL